ncbi:MAG: TRAP transporter substrate-binding protein DctP [Rhodobacteraceae bacterium]|jgi:TRAP-type C4-dicarboxylate transport system substrate-binding protein|nr:TRAP transporter substrate-binding protein DctP [Paracoccaceae bacterium]
MRKFGLTALALLFGTSLLASAAQAERFIVTTNLPPSHWGSVQGGVPFLDCVKTATNGEVEFDYFDSGKLASFFESLNAVNTGIAQISYIVVSAQSDKLPLTGITMLPGLGSSTVEITAATRKVLESDTEIAREYAKNRIVPLMINIFPAYQMLSVGAPFDSVEAISGKKVSSGGGPLLMTLNTLGASGLEMATGDLYLALQQGTIDGTMLSTTSVKAYKLEEVIKSISANGNFGTAAGIWSIDSDVWTTVPDAHKTAFLDCGLKVEQDLAKWADQFVLDTQSDLKALGIEVFDFTPEALAKIEVKLEETRQVYVDRSASRGIDAQKAYDEYMEILSE